MKKVKMSEFILIYFNGCPNAEAAMHNAGQAGVRFRAVDQDALRANDPLNGYSSPTLLMDGKIIFGAKASPGTRSCGLDLPAPEEIRKRIAKIK
jgi:hypothetical protein